MYFKRPSFRRGGSTGIGQLSSNRQMYAGGGNIGGGGIGGRNLGTRTGFNVILNEFGMPYQKPPSTYKPNFNLKGGSYTPRNYPLTVIPKTPSGFVNLMTKFPKTSYGAAAGFGTSTSAVMPNDFWQSSSFAIPTSTYLTNSRITSGADFPYFVAVGDKEDEFGDSWLDDYAPRLLERPCYNESCQGEIGKK